MFYLLLYSIHVTPITHLLSPLYLLSHAKRLWEILFWQCPFRPSRFSVQVYAYLKNVFQILLSPHSDNNKQVADTDC